MEFSEAFDGKCWSLYWNIWILNAVFGILVYLSTFIGWIFSDSETLEKTTFFFYTFMHLADAFMQSDSIQYNILSVHAFLGNRTLDLGVAAQFSICSYLNSDGSELKILDQNWNFRILWAETGAFWNRGLRDIANFHVLHDIFVLKGTYYAPLYKL